MNRARKICSTKSSFQAEIDRIKKLLINNDFPNRIIDQVTRKFVFKEPSGTSNYLNPGENIQDTETGASVQIVTRPDEDRIGSAPQCKVQIYYNNQYHSGYKRDEEALKKILKRHVFQISVEIELIIYYKSKRTSNIIMQNNLSKSKLPDRLRSHIVYEFTCSVGECASSNNSYIGMTNCSLLERMGQHKYKGSIFAHYRSVHNISPTIENLIESSKILYFCDNRRYLPVFEALFIKKLKPNLNGNTRDFSCLTLNIG